MQPSKEQIEAAARLVPDTNNAWSRSRGIPMTTGRQVEEGGAYVIRDWQPWADTEAGRSDWAVLETAVMYWCAKNRMSAVIHDLWWDVNEAAISSDLNKRQAATFAAAVAIGAHMGVSRGQ